MEYIQTVYLSWNDPSTGRQFLEQYALPLTIGRALPSDLILPDRRVSRQHAEIHQEQGQVAIVDLGSTNGIRVDGRRVERATLRDGATVRIGSITLTVTFESPSYRSPATAILDETRSHYATKHLAIENGGSERPLRPKQSAPAAARVASIPAHAPVATTSSVAASHTNQPFLARLGNGHIALVAWSPDGAALAISTSLGVSLRDAKSFAERRFIPLELPSAHLMFAHDGFILVAVSERGIDTCAIDQGSAMHMAFDQPQCVLDAVIDAQGKISALDLGEKVQLRRVDDGALLATLPINTAGLHGCLAFAPDGRQLAAATWDGIQLWSVADGTLVRTLAANIGYIEGLTFSPDATQLAIIADSTITIWDVASGRMLRTIRSRGESLEHVRFAPHGRTIAATSGAAVLIWRTSDGILLRKLQSQSSKLIDFTFSSDGGTIAAATRASVSIWRTNNGTLVTEVGGYQDSVTALAFTPDSQNLATASDSLQLWRIHDGALLRSEAAVGQALSTVFCADKQALATRSVGGMTPWQIGERALADAGPNCDAESDEAAWRILPNDLARAHDIALASEAHILAAAIGNTIHIRHMPDEAQVRVFDNQSGVNSIALSPDGALLAITSDVAVQVWRVSDGRHCYTLDQGAQRLAFSFDSSMLVTVQDALIQVWWARDGNALATLAGHVDTVCALAFAPNGRMLASGSCDGTALLWSLEQIGQY
jgi:WD40 repeat protein